MPIKHDPEADAIYVKLSTKRVKRTRELGDCRHVDYADDGSVVGVEFLFVSGGIEVDDLPERSAVERELEEHGWGNRILV